MSYKDYLDSLNDYAKQNNIPFQGDFELTGHCNLACTFCYVSTNSAQCSTNLSTEQWLTIMRQAVNAGMMRATFTGGEVLTRPDFEELYCKTYDMGVRILLLTNGLLITPKIVEIFKRRPPEGISMTIYGASNSTYKKITGNAYGFDIATKAIELIKSANLPLSLKTIALPELLDEFQLIRNFADKYSLEINLVRYLSPKRHSEEKMDMEWRLSPSQINNIIKIVENNDSYAAVAPKTKSGFLDCNCGKGRFAVCYDGKLVGCLSYTQLYSNLLVDEFDIALQKLRKLLSEQTEFCSDCATCSFKLGCTMCPGLNYAESGSLKMCSTYRKELANNRIL